MEVTAAMVKALRERTGAGMMECKQALVDAQGEAARAERLLRERGAAKAEKRAGRIAREGRVELYLHHDGKGAAMVELNCETDFVARTDDFRELARDVAQHVYACSPRWLSSDDIPAEVLDREREVYRTRGESEGKQDKALDGFVEGQLRGFKEEMCLLEQVFVKDLARPKKERRNIDGRIKETASKLGEKLAVGRFVRFRVGEAAE